MAPNIIMLQVHTAEFNSLAIRKKKINAVRLDSY